MSTLIKKIDCIRDNTAGGLQIFKVKQMSKKYKQPPCIYPIFENKKS